MSPFELIIKNADGSDYWVERFETKQGLNKWLREEQSRPYWKKDFQVEIVDNTEALAEIAKKAKEAAEAMENAQREKAIAIRAAVKAFKDKPSKTVADLAKLLDALLDHLDLKPE